MKEKTSTVSKRSILLWAARDQFTQFGSSGARIDTILEAAQVNKRHLYELFLTKDGLYMAVLSEVSREIEAASTFRLSISCANIASSSYCDTGKISLRRSTVRAFKRP